MSQFFIFVFGASAIWLVGRTDRWKKYGYICGLLAQPFWIYTSIVNRQWGILVMTMFYTYSWIQGIKNYWIEESE